MEHTAPLHCPRYKVHNRRSGAVFGVIRRRPLTLLAESMSAECQQTLRSKMLAEASARRSPARSEPVGECVGEAVVCLRRGLRELGLTGDVVDGEDNRHLTQRRTD